MKKIKKVLKNKDGSNKFTKRLSLPVIFIFAFAALGAFALIRSNAATGNDLVVTNITMSPANPAAGQAVTFSATIQNQGSTPTTAGTAVGVGFKVDGTTVSWNRSNTASLAAGASITLAANAGSPGATWTATAGPHVIEAIADDNNVIPDELNEANNIRTTNLTIGNTGNLYLSPSTATVNINDNFNVALRLTPGINVDSMEATLTYDATKLQYVSMSPTGSLFELELGAQTGGNGTVTVSRGNLNGGVSVDTLITQLTFKAIGGSGATTITTNGNAYKNGPPTNPAKGNATITLNTPDTTAPTATVTAPTASQILTKTINFTANASDNTGVSRVDFYVDGQLKGTDTSSPYSLSLDTTTLALGNHTFMVRAYDAAGNMGASANITATVKNRAEDINEDGIVNIQDFSLLAAKYGQTGTSATLGRADINGDGRVNIQDFSLLAAQYGK